MKKSLLTTIIICLLLILIKYYFSNYKIEYEVSGYAIKTIYKNERFYFEIRDNKVVYNFDIYSKRTFNKTKIKEIKKIDIDNYKCIYPIIKDVKTYPLCFDKDKNILVDFNLINSQELDEYKIESTILSKPNKDFTYYNNLNKNEYIALWVYKGYTIMNNNNYNIVNIFEKDRYDNNLSYIIEDTIYMPNYDEEYEFKTLKSLNIVNQKINSIKLDYYIDYDSYIVGNIKNKLYIYDNKSSVLYEINLKNGKTLILANNEKGYVKYENGKFISCSKNEYKNNKITFDKKSSNYSYEINQSTYKIINDNVNIKTIINNEETKVIYEKNNELFYILDNNFYKYNPLSGNTKIFYYYELSFNNINTVYMYSK